MEPLDRTILVVDDFEENRAAIAKMLAKLDINVIEAPDGESALQMMADNQPVVVLLDADMPELDGYQVINRMHNNENTKHLPVILMTSNLSDRRQKLHKPMLDSIDFINRPLNELTLLSKVESHLELDHYRAIIRNIHSDNEKLLEAMHEGVLGIDSEGVIRFANSAAAQLLRTRVSKLQDTYVETIFEEPNHHAKSNWADHPVAQVCAKNTILQIDQADFWRADGSSIKVKFAAVPMEDLEGMSVVLAFKELSEKRSSSRTPTQRAVIDYLTGLPCRTRFEDLLDEAIHRVEKMGRQLAVLVINLDHFRNINDSLGHEMGDKLLKAVSERMVRTTRKNDVLGRIGGDEFALLVEPLDSPAGAATAAEKIINTLKHVFLLDGHEIFTSCSIGIATYPACGDDKVTLLKNADAAVTKAKALGRNSYQYHSAEINAAIQKQMVLERDLRQAQKREELAVVYSPIITLDQENKQKQVATEVHLEWHHPEKGIIPASEFMGVAEDIDLFAEMASWMCEEALAYLSERDAEVHDGAVASESGRSDLFASISLKHLLRKDFVSWFAGLLDRSEISGERLVLSISEHSLLRHRDQLAESIQKIHGLGVRFALADFGAGYGTFDILRSLPVDVIGLPKAVCRDIASSAQNEIVCRHVTAMAHELGVKVWANDVEDEASFELLRQLGVDFFQGRFFSSFAHSTDS